MTEAQAWEQLYGRRSPDVRVLDHEAHDGAAEEQSRRRAPALQADGHEPQSEAHAA
jgi:hypothetical protein